MFNPEMGHVRIWMLLMCLSFCYHVQLSNCEDPTCNSNDLTALRGFLEGLDSGLPNWGKNASSDCCSWDGVSCESFSHLRFNDSMASGKRVVGLELGGRKLRGKLSESLAGLDQLRTLNLSHNFFSGFVPSKLLRLQNLEVLDFSYNEFFGSFIQEETYLPSIRFLDVFRNSFAGSLSAGICNSSSRIRVMNLSMNYFSGVIPSGFAKCRSLRQLSVSSNALSGTLPEDLFLLQKLRLLHLQDNRFSGSLSTGIRNLSNLIQLDISLNGFSGIIPEIFCALGKIEIFSAHSNRFRGQLPISISNSSSLIFLNLNNNSLNGPINLNCSVKSRLSFLDLGTNQFHGPIPDGLSSCQKLGTLNLARNTLNREIPEGFTNLQALSYLSLSNTSLRDIKSAFGVLQQCRNLTALVLTSNFHGEEMPVDPNLQFASLKALIIANCRLTGQIPSWLRGCTKLQLLDLSWNDLGGTIPTWLGGLKLLFYLDLSNNSFHGEIPKTLTELQSLINGTIWLEEPSTRFRLFIKRNQSERGYNNFWNLPPTVDLSYNNLTEPIWQEFGNLKKLHVLDLSHNSLSGHIPSALSGMVNLEALDLSQNNLSGTIPPSLTNLTFLSRFSVAYNQLVGRIPSDGQFLTFPCSSFEGNKDIHCTNSPPSQTAQTYPELTVQTKRNKLNIIGLPFGIGGVTFFLLTIPICFMSGWVYPKEVKKKRNRG